jgi:DNA-binding phage protein
MMTLMGRAPKPTPGDVEKRIVGILSARIDAAGRGEQARVAKAAGMSAAQLSRCLSGARVMTVTEMLRVCDAVGLHPVAVVAQAQSAASET